MNYGPLEFADYLRRSEEHPASATIRAARAAAPEQAPLNRLSVVAGPHSLSALARDAQLEAVSVYEAVAMSPPSEPRQPGTVAVLVRQTPRPVVLVLSSHQGVEWRLSPVPGSRLVAVLVSGFGGSSVQGVAPEQVHRIGGFYAFKRGSVEFRHLESEVLRCTGRTIENFQSVYAGSRFDIG
jgi:hypothetical protein